MRQIVLTIAITLLTGCLFSEEEEKEKVPERCVPKVDHGLNTVGEYCFKEGEEGFDVDEKCDDVINDKGVAIGRRCVKDGVERIEVQE